MFEEPADQIDLHADGFGPVPGKNGPGADAPNASGTTKISKTPAGRRGIIKAPWLKSPDRKRNSSSSRFAAGRPLAFGCGAISCGDVDQARVVLRRLIGDYRMRFKIRPAPHSRGCDVIELRADISTDR